MPNKPLSNAVSPQATTPLAKILADYNAGRGGPEGMTLLSILAQQKDPRAQHWSQWERQRQQDNAANDQLLYGLTKPPADMPSNIQQARVPGGFPDPNQFQIDMTNGPVAQGQPMAPGQYEAMMSELTRRDLQQRGRASPLGREQAMKNANNNLQMLWDKERINNAVMPAEVGSPGLSGHLFELFRTAIGDKRAL